MTDTEHRRTLKSRWTPLHNKTNAGRFRYSSTEWRATVMGALMSVPEEQESQDLVEKTGCKCAVLA